MKDKIKVLIADEHSVFRQGLKQIIESNAQLQLVAEADDGWRALELLKKSKPEVAVLGVNMPGISSFDIVRELTKLNLRIQVILIMHKDEAIFGAALDSGVKGYLLKESALNDVVAGITTIANGEPFISQPLTAFLFNRCRNIAASRKEQSTANKLTQAERRVLKFIAEDKTSREIADLLFISVRTVEGHRQNVCKKLEIRGSNALLKYAITHKERLCSRSA